MNQLNLKEVNIYEVCDVERAKKGKCYPAKCTVMGISACGETETRIGYYESGGEIPDRYAVLIPKEGIDGEYLHYAAEAAYERFYERFQQTINLPFSAIRQFQTGFHPKKEDRELVLQILRPQTQAIETQEQIQKQWEDLKEILIDKMMV